METELISTHQIRPLAKTFAAEVVGMRLGEAMSSSQRADLENTIAKYYVVVFRDQNLTAEQQNAFTKTFGEMQGNIYRMPDGVRVPATAEVSNVDSSGKLTNVQLRDVTGTWHTDGSFYAVPPWLSILQALILPPSGGDTQFADMHAAYEALTPAEKERYARVQVVHNHADRHLNSGARQDTEEEARETPAATHPLVRTDPATGKKSLYCGLYATGIVGMSGPEGRKFLADVAKYATKPEFVFTQVWQPGDLVIWDNRFVMHRAVPNFEIEKHKRVLRRTVVKGTESPQ